MVVMYARVDYSAEAGVTADNGAKGRDMMTRMLADPAVKCSAKQKSDLFDQLLTNCRILVRSLYSLYFFTRLLLSSLFNNCRILVRSITQSLIALSSRFMHCIPSNELLHPGRFKRALSILTCLAI
jgi:hypothetical protein